MKRLLIAIGFLTRLPTPRSTASLDDMAGAMRWFPIVGVLIGAIVAAGAWVGAFVDAWVAALGGLALWVAVTGALHLDGLGDIADAAGAAHGDPGRSRAVLADPHLGSFAVVSIVLQLMAKLVLLHTLVERGAIWPLVTIPAVARIGPLIWACWLPPLHDGLGAAFGKAVRMVDVVGWSAALLALSVALPGVLPAFLLVPAWGWWLARRIGGISGDGHGAGIELIETGLLLALACLTI
jgi:adenosylcobinamide-GDP ribazoletransferase